MGWWCVNPQVGHRGKAAPGAFLLVPVHEQPLQVGKHKRPVEAVAIPACAPHTVIALGQGIYLGHEHLAALCILCSRRIQQHRRPWGRGAGVKHVAAELWAGTSWRVRDIHQHGPQLQCRTSCGLAYKQQRAACEVSPHMSQTCCCTWHAPGLRWSGWACWQVLLLLLLLCAGGTHLL